MAAPAGEKRYEETELILGEVVALFSDRADIKTVQEAGNATAELKSLCDARHKEMMQSIRGARTRRCRMRRALFG